MRKHLKTLFNKKSLGLVLLILAVFILASCTRNQTTQVNEVMETGDDSAMETDAGDIASDEHIGCQEGEISIDGTCSPALAEDNNASLFGQDLDQYVDYEDVDDGVVGFLAKPKAEGEYPGVVMIHEWWGLNDNIKEMAKLLAKEGYVVFAVDLYNGEVATDSTRAGELATNVRNNPTGAVADMQAAVAYLEDNYNVTKLGSIGWCFGGGQSLALSLNKPLDATVIYYGQLTTDPEELAKIAGPVLGIFGSEDTSIPVETVNSFEAGLNQAGIKNDVNIYDGVGHAFANPSGSNYAKGQTLDAWTKTVAFFSANLKSEAMMDNDGDAMMEEGEDAMMDEQDTVVFNLTGENFKFLRDGQERPELRVKLGDKVRINFTSTAGFHDWVVDEFNAATDQVNTGESTSVEFTADKAGTFEYYCSVGSHRQMGMFGSLIVE